MKNCKQSLGAALRDALVVAEAGLERLAASNQSTLPSPPTQCTQAPPLSGDEWVNRMGAQFYK
jgi:porphobilinogen deaminase